MWPKLLKPLDKLMRPIDKFVDGITMYRLLLYYLVGLLAAAATLSTFGNMHYKVLNIVVSSGILVLACWIINTVFGSIFDAPINPESSILTGLILALIISPSFNNFGLLFMLAAAGLAIASKYILAIGEKHIFNPAAIAVVLTSLGPHQSPSWWVDTSVMLPWIIIGGVLIMRKVRKVHMVITFLIVTTVTTAIFSVIGHTSASNSLHNMALSSPIFFLGFVMLTEPYTSPTTRRLQIIYASIVGFLLAPQIHIGSFYTSPEIALVVGNLFTYIVGPKTKLFPVLKQKHKIADNTFEFVFDPVKKLNYKPGQYMEWTLPHNSTDSRGSRRWFTLASSPTEADLRLGVKFYKNGSSYKQALLKIDENSSIAAGQIAGDFMMPKETDKKLVFIAGGIGVTPFRSMIKYLIDTKQKRPVRVLYGARTEEDIAYKSIFEEARNSLGIQTKYILSEVSPGQINQPNTDAGFINLGYIKQSIPDYSSCYFYVSGTHPMVESIQIALHQLGVHPSHIKLDFFPGYA